MSDDPQPIDPITAERLIRGARSESPVHPDTLAELLAAAAAPAREEELAGEERAVMAFRDARLARAPRRRRRFVLKSVLVKASVVAAVAVVGGGGVALAASTGHLPGTSSTRTHTSARASHGAAGATASGHTSRPEASGTHRSAASHTGEPSGSPSPDMRGLCTAFRAHPADNPGKALASPAFKALIARAGGKGHVATYCTSLLATPAGKAAGHGSDASTHASTHAPSHRPHRSSHAPRSRPTKPGPTHSTASHRAPSTTNTHAP